MYRNKSAGESPADKIFQQMSGAWRGFGSKELEGVRKHQPRQPRQLLQEPRNAPKSVDRYKILFTK